MQSRIGYGRKLTILQSDPALTDLDVYMPFLMVQELHFKREFSIHVLWRLVTISRTGEEDTDCLLPGRSSNNPSPVSVLTVLRPFPDYLGAGLFYFIFRRINAGISISNPFPSASAGGVSCVDGEIV